MAQSYTRQSTFADGDTITAALFNNEYNQLVNAFTYSSSSESSTGHRHDGTAGHGGNIHTIGDLDFLNKIVVDSTNNRWGFFVQVSSSAVEQMRLSDGVLAPVTDSDVDLGTSSLYWKDAYIDSITTTGNVSVGGNLTVTGTTTFNGGTLTLGDAADDNVVFGADVNSNIIPNTDNAYDLGSSSQEWKDLYVDGIAYLDGINFNGTAITATAAELNIMDGVTATAAEINALDGITSTVAELNILDGVTSTAAEINLLDGVTSTTAELNILDGVTATAAEINLLDGVTSTTAELNILDGVTSTATELNIVDGNTSATSTTLADADRVVVNDNGTMVQVALTDFETYFESALDTLSNVTTVGALNSGSITSGFGAIDNGSSAITTTGTVTYGSLSDGSITITAFVDEDDMSSDSATLVPTQQSIKAYVDSQVTAQDLDATTDSGTIDIDLDSETLTIAGGEGIDTSASGTTITIAGEEASTSNKGVASFDSNDFTVSSGAVSLATTSTAAELNILDGVTATTAELNIMDGVTATTAELNIMDGVTATAAEINTLDGITSTVAELNILDGVTASATDINLIDGITNGTVIASKAIITDANKDITGGRNITISGELDAATLDISGNADIDGTLEADAYTVNGTNLDEYIEDTVGAMLSSNTETGIAVTYQDGDSTIDFALDAAQTGITSLLATDIKIGEDDQTKIDFETADEIHFYAANAEQVYVADGIFGPQTDSDVDLGSTSVRWKDAYVDSITTTGNAAVGGNLTLTGDLTVNGTTSTVNSTTVTIDDPIFTLGGDSAPGSDDNKDRGIEFRWHNGSAAKVGFFGYDDSASAFTFVPDATNSSEVFSGTVGNAIFGNITGTLQTAAQTNITSLGTLSSATISGDLTVDTSTLKVDSSNNRVGIGNASPDVSLDIGSLTDAMHVPVGTTAQRPGSPAAGYFRYNTTTSKFEGYTDSWGSIGGGSGTNMDTNIFAGDGSDTTFTLSNAPDTENNLMVFIDGVFQAHDSYSVSGTTLTFSTAPASGRVITAYHSTTTVGGSNNSIATMTGDGSDTTLTLSINPVHENNVSVFFDGVYQSKSNYSISGTTLTFSTAPPNGVAVEAITATTTSITTATQLLDADSDTMIQVEESSDEDKIRFDTGGTERMIIDSTGVGIGTSSPSANLHIYSTADNKPHLLLENFQNADTDDAPVIELYTNDQTTGGISDDTDVGVIRFTGDEKDAGGKETYAEIRGVAHDPGSGSSNKGNLSFFVQAAGDLHETLTLDEKNVGINTTSPSAWLEVKDDGSLAQDMVLIQGGGASGAYKALQIKSNSGDDIFHVNALTYDTCLVHGSAALGIGTASPSRQLTVEKSSDHAIIGAVSGTSSLAGMVMGDTSDDDRGAVLYNNNGDYMYFQVDATERLRINSSGRQGYGQSANYNGHGNFVGEVGTSSKALMFEHTVGGGEVGSVTTGSSSTAYNTSSDYRLKENIDYTWDATTRLKQLKPARFNWIVDDTNTLVDGFLAHEVSSIVPEAISGDKDATETYTDDNGDEQTRPKYQGIDHSKLVPLLVKTIQELESRITALES